MCDTVLWGIYARVHVWSWVYKHAWTCTCHALVTPQCYVIIQVYVKDNFGLRTLDETGRMKVYVVPHIEHLFWPWDKDVFETYIKPWLQ